MRGNRRQPDPEDRIDRSIPAYAGEPFRRRCPADCEPVYPRVCGGTIAFLSGQLVIDGLSPRMRGNRPQPDGPPPF